MTFEETTGILTLLKISYPNHYKQFTKQEAAALIKFWSSNYEFVDIEVMYAAVNKYINTNTSGFPPTPAQLNSIIYELSGETPMPVNDAIALIKRAAGRASQRATEDFEALPPLCKKIVGNPGTLKEWAMIDEREFVNFTVPRLEKAYTELVSSEKARDIAPAALADLSAKVKFRLEHSDKYSLAGEV